MVGLLEPDLEIGRKSLEEHVADMECDMAMASSSDLLGYARPVMHVAQGLTYIQLSVSCFVSKTGDTDSPKAWL